MNEKYFKSLPSELTMHGSTDFSRSDVAFPKLSNSSAQFSARRAFCRSKVVISLTFVDVKTSTCLHRTCNIRYNVHTLENHNWPVLRSLERSIVALLGTLPLNYICKLEIGKYTDFQTQRIARRRRGGKFSSIFLSCKWNFACTCRNDSSRYFNYYGFPAVAVRHSQAWRRKCLHTFYGVMTQITCQRSNMGIV